MIQHFYYNSSYIYYANIYVLHLHIPPLVPSSNVSSISESVNNSNSILVFFKHACRANPVADKK